MRATRLTWSPEHACSANARAGWQSVNTAWPAPHTTRSKIPVSRDPRYCPGPQTISPPAPRRLPTAQEAGCGEPRHADQVLTKGLSIKAECSQSPGGAGPLPREAHERPSSLERRVAAGAASRVPSPEQKHLRPRPGPRGRGTRRRSKLSGGPLPRWARARHGPRRAGAEFRLRSPRGCPAWTACPTRV